MPKTIRIPDGLLTLAESKAVCPHCNRTIPFEEIEDNRPGYNGSAFLFLEHMA